MKLELGIHIKSEENLSYLINGINETTRILVSTTERKVGSRFVSISTCTDNDGSHITTSLDLDQLSTKNYTEALDLLSKLHDFSTYDLCGLINDKFPISDWTSVVTISNCGSKHEITLYNTLLFHFINRAFCKTKDWKNDNITIKKCSDTSLEIKISKDLIDRREVEDVMHDLFDQLKTVFAFIKSF